MVDLMKAISQAYKERSITRFKQLVTRWGKAAKKSRESRKSTDDVQRFDDQFQNVPSTLNDHFKSVGVTRRQTPANVLVFPITSNPVTVQGQGPVVLA